MRENEFVKLYSQGKRGVKADFVQLPIIPLGEGRGYSPGTNWKVDS